MYVTSCGTRSYRCKGWNKMIEYTKTVLINKIGVDSSVYRDGVVISTLYENGSSVGLWAFLTYSRAKMTKKLLIRGHKWANELIEVAKELEVK